MERTSSGKIRKLIVGENPRVYDESFIFEVGKPQAGGMLEITQIERDENAYFIFGDIRYNVWAKKGDKPFIWKYFENVPVTVECFMPE